MSPGDGLDGDDDGEDDGGDDDADDDGGLWPGFDQPRLRGLGRARVRLSL